MSIIFNVFYKQEDSCDPHEEQKYLDTLSELIDQIQQEASDWFEEEVSYFVTCVNPETNLVYASSDFPDIFITGQVGEWDDDGSSREDTIPEFQARCTVIAREWKNKYHYNVKVACWWLLVPYGPNIM